MQSIYDEMEVDFEVSEQHVYAKSSPLIETVRTQTNGMIGC